jgi:ABC-2 type transport system ATP-binding protein
MLTTRVVPTGGRAFVDGIDVVAEPARAKERIGVVTQTNTLDRSLDVRENLEFHARCFGIVGRAARAAADRMLEVMRLTEKASADVGTLSGGMAQRLMVARAILHRPEVLSLLVLSMTFLGAVYSRGRDSNRSPGCAGACS